LLVCTGAFLIELGRANILIVGIGATKGSHAVSFDCCPQYRWQQRYQRYQHNSSKVIVSPAMRHQQRSSTHQLE